MLHLSVYIAPTGEERDELLWGVTPVHVEGAKTAVLAAEVTGQALQLSLVIVRGVQWRFRKAWIAGTSGTMPYESK